MIFANDTRDKMKQENPDWKVKQIGKDQGRIWNDVLTAEEKAVYVQRVKDSKVQYVASERSDEKQDAK